MKRVNVIAYLLLLLLYSCGSQPEYAQVRGWNILSDSYEDALVTIAGANRHNINHLQLSHSIVMDLCEIRDSAKHSMVTDLTKRAHDAGIEEVVVWDHALYNLSYYPERFRTASDGRIDLDNEEFWIWFKEDYRDMLNRIPEVDGLVLTFIETGARAENQHSERLTTGAEKLAAVVDAVAEVVCGEYGKELYIRTFAYTDAEYENTIGCINHIRSKDIILMMKETPHDFFLTHPNDKYAGTIDRPTIIEFDTGNEFNGQGIIANTWPEYVIGRWSKYVRMPNIVGYVARTDRYRDTRLVGTPNEILLSALSLYTADTGLTADAVYEKFITERYGAEAVSYVKPAFASAFEIVTSSMYTLGTNTANHSSLNYDPYKSSYGRHVSGKWLAPPIAKVEHGVGREFHYWKDVIEHLAPARLKEPDGPIKTEAPYVIDSAWVTPTEMMNEEYLRYVMAEKENGVNVAQQALLMIRNAKGVLNSDDYNMLYTLFERTLLTARIHEAVATAYWGYRIYARGAEFRTPFINGVLNDALERIEVVSKEITAYDKRTATGQWDWRKDAQSAMKYHDMILEGWPEYGEVRIVR